MWAYKVNIIKDEVLLTVGCTIFPMYLFIAKYLFTGNFKDRSIDIQKRKKYIFQWKISISLIIYSMQNRNKLEIKF